MAQAKKFGAFSGVFTPSILTILGVIMYLRLPSIVGQAGLWMAVGIVLVAHVISVSTGLSVSSIATDKKVQAGGTYYMISRSLGLPIGGTLGLALFMGLSFSVSLYVIGFSESFLSYWDWTVSKNTIRLTGSITLLVVTTVTLISTSLALKTQFFIMAAIGLSLVSILFGQHDFAPDAPLLESLPDAVPFIVLFGIFFPAVTGFEAGVSMSGDLKDPKKDIPSGTMWAIGIGLVSYIGLIFFFAYTVSAEQLAGNPNVLLDISFFAPAVVAGIWGATISSALGSILGAPRILQATAVDRITPRWFARGYGKENEPRHALILTFVIAEAGILIGELDVIARIVSMFFITTYGFLNLSCAIESWASPDFRPDFKIPKTVSIIGSVACFIVMIQLDFVAMIGASVVLGGLYLYLTRKQLTLESGDTWEGVWSSLVRTGLNRLNQGDHHVRNWRPNVILFSGGTQARPHLIQFGQWLVKKRGLLSNFDLNENPEAPRLLPKTSVIVKEKEGDEMGVFSRRLTCRDIYEAMGTIARYYGFAGIEPNAVLMGWARNSRDPAQFAQLLHTFSELDLNLMLVDYDQERGFGKLAEVDVWWRGGGNNISFALALIGFLKSSDAWREASVRFLVVNDRDTARTDTIYERTYSLLEAYRIEATVKVINNVVEQKPIQEIVRLELTQADLTILGVPEVEIQAAEGYISKVNGIIDALGTVLLIRASSFFQELSLGLEGGLLPVAPLETAASVEATLPALNLPEAEVLRQAVVRFNDRFDALNAERVEPLLRGGYHANQKLIDALSDYVERSLTALERSLTKDHRMRNRRVLLRTQSALLFQSQRILSSFSTEQLPLLQETLDSGLFELRAGLRDLIRKTPEILTVIPEASLFVTAPSDGLLLRLWKQGKRLASRLTGTPSAYDMWFQSLVEQRLTGRYQECLFALFKAYGRASYEAVWSVQKLLRDVVDGLDRIENRLAETSDVSAEVTEETEQARAAITRMSEALQLQRTEAHSQFLVDTRHFVQTVSDEAARPAIGRLSAPGKSGSPVHEGLAEVPALWYGNQLFLLNRAGMDLTLLALQHRLSTIVQRMQYDLQQQVRQGVLGGYDSLRADLQAFSEAIQADPKARFNVPRDYLPPFDEKAVIDKIVQDLRAASQEVPETVWTMREESFQTLTEEPFEAVAPVAVALRRMVDYLIEVEFIGPLQEEIASLSPRLERAEAVAQDVLHLTTFHLGNPEHEIDAASFQDHMDMILSNGIERLSEEYDRLATSINGLDPFIETRLRMTFEQLNAYAITRSEGRLQQYVRGHKSREVISRFKAARQYTQTLLSDRLVRLLYQRSEGVLYARRLQEAHATGRAAADEGLALLEAATPREDVLKALPFYYRQLFLGTPTLTKDLWGGWAQEQAQAKQAIGRYRQGFLGGLVIAGEPLAGKTALSYLIASTHFQEEQTYPLNPPDGGSIEVDVLERRLQETLGLQGNADTCFNSLPKGSVLILNDLGGWWERSDHGFAAIDEILDWIDRYSDRCFFILNVNAHTFRLMNTMRNLEDHFLSVITCTPSNAEEIKEIILLRHRSTGLTFEWEGQIEDELSEWKLAKLFTAFFDYARGNVGVALQAWISHIQKATKEQITMRAPVVPSVDILEHLKPLQVALLLQFILHGALTLERLRRISGLQEAHLHLELNALKRFGMIVETSNQVLTLQTFLVPHLMRALMERRLLR